MKQDLTETKQVTKGVSRFLLTSILLTILFVVSFFIAYFSDNIKENTVLNFEECLNISGSIIQESYPRVCRLKNGKTFTENIPSPTTTGVQGKETETNERKCITSGCNNEICQDESEEPQSSICIYEPRFECYKGASCEVQENGECGWTITDELVSCLNKI